MNKPNPKVLRALHLASELSTATELLSLGLNQVANPKRQARQPGGAFNQLSQGVERLLKATFWVYESSNGRSVDSRFGSGASGHAIADLDERVFDIYVSESQSATPYMRDLIAEACSDPYWQGGWGNLTEEDLLDSRRRLMLSFMRWWHVHYRAWQHGLVGADGEQFSSEIRPASLHLDPSVAALVDGR